MLAVVVMVMHVASVAVDPDGVVSSVRTGRQDNHIADGSVTSILKKESGEKLNVISVESIGVR